MDHKGRLLGGPFSLRQGFSGLLWLIEIQPTPSSSGLTPVEVREERLAKNEIVFRTVNESIQELSISLGGPDNYEFICECSARDCLDRVMLTRVQYEYVRAEGTRFFVMPGHENVAVEEVVETMPTYLVVEKDGHAGVVADFADPRDGDS
jgi:hypothetical protein